MSAARLLRSVWASVRTVVGRRRALAEDGGRAGGHAPDGAPPASADAAGTAELPAVDAPARPAGPVRIATPWEQRSEGPPPAGAAADTATGAGSVANAPTGPSPRGGGVVLTHAASLPVLHRRALAAGLVLVATVAGGLTGALAGGDDASPTRVVPVDERPAVERGPVGPAGTPTRTPGPTRTASRTPTHTASPTTPAASATGADAPDPDPSSTPVPPEPEPTANPSAAPTQRPTTAPPTATPTATPTGTGSQSPTPDPTPTPTDTGTPSPSPSDDTGVLGREG
jgi:hypothetical protein